MAQDKKWAHTKKEERVVGHLKSLIEEALPGSRPQTHINHSSDKDQITLVFFHKSGESLEKFNKMVARLQNQVFKTKANVGVSDNENIGTLSVAGKIDDLLEGLNVDFVSEYLKRTVEAIDVKPPPTAEIAATKISDNKHQFYVNIIRNNGEPYSRETKDFHSEVIKMMQDTFNKNNVTAEKIISEGIPPMDNVTITGAVNDIIENIRKTTLSTTKSRS